MTLETICCVQQRRAHGLEPVFALQFREEMGGGEGGMPIDFSVPPVYLSPRMW